MSLLFNHEISYTVAPDPSEAGVELRHVVVKYDDPFGVRREFRDTFLAHKVERVQIGGTAMSTVDVFNGVVVNVCREDRTLMAISNAQVVPCVYSKEEDIQPYDRIKIVEHMVHEYGVMEGRFDWLATKREGNFKLNSIRVILFDRDGNEVGVIYLDPYLPGYLHYGYSRT